MTNKRAFTLIEVCVAMMILFVFMFSLVSVFKTGAKVLLQNNEIENKVISLTSYAEKIYAMPLTGVASLDGQTFYSGDGEIKVSTIEGFYVVQISMTGIFKNRSTQIYMLKKK